MTLVLRSATESDARLLFEWRNDPLTRHNSLETRPVAWEEHLRWLQASLALAERRLLIAELDREPVGTARLDQGAEFCEVSWTVAPARRGRGLGKAIVSAAIAAAGSGTLIARIKETNAASIRIAEACGLRRVACDGGIATYRRG